MLKVAIGTLLSISVAAAAFTSATLHWTYSDGERAGYVQKLTRKGWLCKTWEGELAMVTVPGTAGDKFQFTVRDDAVANRLNVTAGERVALHYEQHKLIPSPASARLTTS